MSKIDLSNISHSYNPNETNPVYALNPFSMTWQDGARYAILGPSGCGKTTTLRMIAGLEDPDIGEISYGEKIFFSSKKSKIMETAEEIFSESASFPVPIAHIADCFGQG